MCEAVGYKDLNVARSLKAKELLRLKIRTEKKFSSELDLAT